MSFLQRLFWNIFLLLLFILIQLALYSIIDNIFIIGWPKKVPCNIISENINTTLTIDSNSDLHAKLYGKFKYGNDKCICNGTLINFEEVFNLLIGDDNGYNKTQENVYVNITFELLKYNHLQHLFENNDIYINSRQFCYMRNKQLSFHYPGHPDHADFVLGIIIFIIDIVILIAVLPFACRCIGKII